MTKLLYVPLFLLLVQPDIDAKTINLTRNNENYSACVNNKEYIRLKYETTKVGIWSTKISGYIKNYAVQSELNNDLFTNIKVTLNISEIDTNDNDNNKLIYESLDYKTNPNIAVQIPGPVQIGQREYPATIDIRGKIHPITVNINLVKDEAENKYIVSGSSVSSLKTLEIPNKSSAMAKLSDPLWFDFNLIIPISIPVNK